MRFGLLVSLLLFGTAATSAPALALSAAEAARKLEAIKWYSEEYPPYNFTADGKLTGMAVEILMAAFERLGVNLGPEDIKVVPWNRSYKYLKSRPGTALFSMTRTPDREKIMKFVGTVIPIQVAVIAPKSAKLSGMTPDGLGKLTIGAVRDDIGDLLAQQASGGKARIVRKNSLKQHTYLLSAGRVDAVSYSTDVFNFALRKSGKDPKDYRTIYELKNGLMGFAFHRDTEDAVLAHLQKAIDALSDSNALLTISIKYLEKSRRFSGDRKTK